MPLQRFRAETGQALYDVPDAPRRGTWQVRDQTPHLPPFAKLAVADRDALLTEAVQLSAFIAPQMRSDIVVDKP